MRRFMVEGRFAVRAEDAEDARQYAHKALNDLVGEQYEEEPAVRVLYEDKTWRDPEREDTPNG